MYNSMNKHKANTCVTISQVKKQNDASLSEVSPQVPAPNPILSEDNTCLDL